MLEVPTSVIMIDVDGEVFVNCKKGVTVINFTTHFYRGFCPESGALYGTARALRAFEFLILYWTCLMNRFE